MNNMKGIYLASFKAYHENYDIVYQDINGKRDIAGDMLDVDLLPYDFIIATPPCNYYSRGNYRRDTSEYSLNTKHLLPDILNKLSKQKKPFIVENVRAYDRFNDLGLFDLPNVYVYFIGRHTYWTNKPFGIVDIYQEYEFKLAMCSTGQKHAYRLKSNCQGGGNVHNVIERWLSAVVNNKYYNYQTTIFDFIGEDNQYE